MSAALASASRPERSSRPDQRRSDELEAVTRAFTALVEGSLQNAEAKARQIGSVLADCGRERRANAISDQFERIRATSGEEGERTAAALRAAYEQAAAEMAEALGSATAKFRETMARLRGMTGADPARTGRHPGRTPPRRRRAAAGNAGDDGEHAPGRRRPDQGAQRAFGSRLALHPGGRCGARRAAAPGQRTCIGGAASPRPWNDGAVAPVQSAHMPIRTHRTGHLRPPRRAETSPAPARLPGTRSAGPGSGAPATPPDGRTPCAGVRYAGASPRGDGSPVSLTAPRATRKNQATDTGAFRTARRSTASNRSNSISVDIARMIDHDAAVELWDRYKRGESNVFSRRLYTPQGQQTFDEIRRKYAAMRNSSRPSIATSRSSSGFWRKFRATTATRCYQDLSHVGNRQGLHHAGPRERPVRLIDICLSKTKARPPGRVFVCQFRPVGVIAEISRWVLSARSRRGRLLRLTQRTMSSITTERAWSRARVALGASTEAAGTRAGRSAH